MKKLSEVLCALSHGRLTFILMAGMLFACWWPFHAPRNSISWGSDDRGAVFEDSAVLIGTQPLSIGSKDTSTTIEMWLRPEGERDDDSDKGTIVSFYSEDDSREFRIDQYETGIALRWGDGGEFYAPAEMSRDALTSITITSDAAGVKVYANGRLARSNSDLHITSATLNGNLVFGTSAGSDNIWLGELRGFTIYDRVLSHPTIWTEDTQPDPDGLQVFYRFDKPTRGTIPNLGPAGGGLQIPEKFTVPEKNVLAPLTFEHPDDFSLNIVGFVPFGFFLCGFLETRHARYPILKVAILSTMFSLTIELVQVTLPTRDSSLTDVLTNFLGGTIGAWLWRWVVSKL